MKNFFIGILSASMVHGVIDTSYASLLVVMSPIPAAIVLLTIAALVMFIALQYVEE